MLDASFSVDSILSHVSVWGTEKACLDACTSKAFDSASQTQAPRLGKGARADNRLKDRRAIIYKSREWPTNLFCERAIDPQRELFWTIDWSKVRKRGAEMGGWNLVDESSKDLAPLQTEGQGVNDWVKEVEVARGIVTPKAARNAAQKDKLKISTPSTAATGTGTGKRRGRPPRNRSASPSRLRQARSKLAKGSVRGNDDEEVDSDAASSFDSSESEMFSDSDVESTAITSDEEEMDMDEEDGDGEFGKAVTPGKRKRGRPVGSLSTPTKRRGLSTPRKAQGFSSPAKAYATPRSRARLLGRKNRTLPHPSLPLRPPVISSLSVEQLSALTPQERARRLLHVGATPEHLPCREDQYEEVLACVEDAVEEGIGSCVYVSGVPGTGKTATVREVIRALTARAQRNEMNPFTFVEINGMKLPDANQAYSLLWSAISGGQRASPKAALALLSSHFARVGAGAAGAVGMGGGAGPGRAATVVLMDELDQLVTSRQEVMYNMFNWPNTQGSRLIVIAVANTMDLPERTLNPKVASRLGMTRITFMPYNDRQLVQIVQSRLGIQPAAQQAQTQAQNDDQAKELDKAATAGCETVFSADAITYVSKRVSNVSGDARRMLDVCRRAVELVESRARPALTGNTTPLESASVPTPATSPPIKQITIHDMRQVLDSMVKSGKVGHIATLPLHAKMVLLSLLNVLRRSGLAEATVGDVFAHHAAVCRMHAIARPGAGDDASTSTFNAEELAHPLAALCALGLVIAVGAGCGPGKATAHGRLMIACQEDEVRLAFEHDPDERLRKML